MRIKVSIKNEMRKMLKQIPNNATWEDLQYHIYVRQKVERALKAAEKGPWYTTEQVRKRLLKK